jgi:hypothetical protein
MSVERVTKKDADGHYYMSGDGIFSDWGVPEKFKGEDVDAVGTIEDILGDTYDLDRLRELVEADSDGRCMVLPFLPPKVMWSCSKRQPKPAKSFYASEIGILADMKAGCVFGETPEEAEAALTNKENHVKK